MSHAKFVFKKHENNPNFTLIEAKLSLVYISSTESYYKISTLKIKEKSTYAKLQITMTANSSNFILRTISYPSYSWYAIGLL